jgi:hypothetical protein
MENLVANYTDPTSRPGDPGVEQPDSRLGEAVSTGTVADSEMNYPTAEGSSGAVSSESEGGSTVETAKSEGANIKDTAVGAASGVKDVAKSEVSNVAGEAKYQARNLVDQTRSELRGQASNQQSQLASTLNSWASELGSMASKSEESGPMTHLAHEAARRGGEIAHWLDTHEPADVLEEVKRFARRRPVAFLALAAAAGVVAGRVTRGAVAANTSVDSDAEPSPARAYDSGVHDSDTAPSTRGYQDGDYTPRYGDTVPAGAGYQSAGTAAPDQPGPAGTAYPNVTPTSDETHSHYPPRVEGELGR